MGLKDDFLKNDIHQVLKTVEIVWGAWLKKQFLGYQINKQFGDWHRETKKGSIRLLGTQNI